MESLNEYFNTHEFQTQYIEKLKPVLKEVDRLLKPNLKVDIWQTLLLLGSLTYIAIVWAYLSKIIDKPALIVLITTPAVVGLFYSFLSFIPANPESSRIKARSLYKQKVIKPILQKAYKDFKYVPNQRLSIKTKEKSLLFKEPIIVDEGEDYFKFRLNDKVLHFCESPVFHERTNMIQNDAHIGPGIFISVDFPKSFQCKCVVLQEKSGFMQNKQVSRKHTYSKNILSSKSLPLIKLENSEFESLFAVYGDDPIKTRYILTPSFMDRFVKLFVKFQYNFDASFIDNRMYIKVKTNKDLFEPSNLHTNEDIYLLQDNLKIIGDITDIIKELNLDTRIWKA